MMTMQREEVSKIRGELEPLVQAHYLEVAHYSDIPLDVDWDGYRLMEVDHPGFGLRCYTLRDEGILRGYAVFMLRTNLHYRGSLQAVQDVVYLDPPLRGQRIGARFLDYCDGELRKEQVQVVYHHSKITHDFGATLEHLGYELIEKIYGRRLDKT